MPRDPQSPSRRDALKCLAAGGAGTLFVLSGGVLLPVDLATAKEGDATAAGTPLFVQLSDTHIGFAKDANPDVVATLRQAVALVNAMPRQPALVLHTGDITHLSKPAEFDLAQQLLGQLRVPELHTVPGEHDVGDGTGTEYFSRFGKPSQGRGYYSFDHAGVHFVGLVNVLQFRPGGLGTLGEDQLAWVAADLRHRSASTPIVVFAHMPLWTIHEPWGWGTGDAGRLMSLLGRFGSVTVLNGHIHQVVQKTEGHVTFHTARSTAYPQPAPGEGSGPGPLRVPAEELPRRLGVSSVSIVPHPRSLAIVDATLADAAPAHAARVVIREFMFQPMTLSIDAGTTVTWTNEDDEAHTIRSESRLFASGALDTHESFSFRFERPGTYRYVCSMHPRMVAVVVVR